MSQKIAGTASDLPKSVNYIVLELIQNNYPSTGYTPVKDKIFFSTEGFNVGKSYGISVQKNGSPVKTPKSLGINRLEQYRQQCLIHVWVKKNVPKEPTELFNICQKVETIINTNTKNAGYGINSIKLIEDFGEADSGFFGGGSIKNHTEKSIWHNQAVVELVYNKVITHV